MTLSDSYLQILRECSRDSTSFQRLVELIEPLFENRIDPFRGAENFSPNSTVVENSEIENLGQSQDPSRIESPEKHLELETFFSITLDLWCVADTNGYFLKLNKMWEFTLGYNLDELIGQRFLDFVHPDDLQATLDAIAILDAQNPILNFTNRYRCKDGSYRFIEWRSQPQGKLIYASARDVTEHKQTQQMILDSEIQLRAIFDNSIDAIFLTIPDGRILAANKAASRMFGYSEQELIEKGRNAIIDLSDPRLPIALEQRHKTGHFTGELTFIRRDTSKFVGDVSTVIFKDAQGNHQTSMIIRDVTERKQMEARQAELSAIVESSVDGIIGRTLDGIITSWNRGAEMIYGYTADEMVGQSMGAVVPVDRIHELAINLNRIERGENVKQYETVRLRKDGTRVDVALTISPIKSKDGTIIGVSTINQDITELKEAQDALRESEERYRAIVTTMTEGIVLQAQDGSIQTCNLAAERILGLTAEHLAGRKSIDPEWRAIHEDFSPFPGETHPAMVTLQTGKPVSNVIMGVHKPDGTLTWILVNSQPLFQPGEVQPSAVVASFADITEIRRMEQALQESEARLRSIFDTIQDAVWSIELPSFQMTYMNPAGSHVFGRSVEAFYEQPDLRARIIHPEDLPRIQDWRIKILDQGTTDLEYRILRPDGEIRHVHNRSWLIRNAQGEPFRIEGIVSDITERKIMQEQALQLEVEQERAQLLSDFISNTSHELRTPLTIIGTSLYLMTRMNDEQQRQTKAAQVERQINYLNNLIKQLHEMVKLDRLTQLEIAPIQLNELTQRLIMNYPPHNRHIVLASNLASDLPEIMGDYNYIKLAVSYLIDNANQFSPDGSEVIVRTSLENSEVIIEIEDRGLGIAPEHLSRIFEHFYKADSGRTRGENGAGMGLAFVKRIMKLHHGRVTVQSTEGEGSIFRLYFPLPGGQTNGERKKS